MAVCPYLQIVSDPAVVYLANEKRVNLEHAGQKQSLYQTNEKGYCSHEIGTGCSSAKSASGFLIRLESPTSKGLL